MCITALEIRNTTSSLLRTEPLPNIKLGECFHDTKVCIVENLEEALLDVYLIVFAIPGQFIKSFVKSHEDLLYNGSKILVDPTNYKAEKDLESALEEFHNVVFWVKAFNNNGAVTLMAQKPSTKAKLSLRSAGLTPMPLNKSNSLLTDMKSVQQSIGKECFI